MDNSVTQGCGTADIEQKKEKQSTSKQFIVAVFILSLAAKMFLFPIVLIRTAGRDGYIALSVFADFDLLSLIAGVAALKLSKDTDFFTVLSSVVGKVAARIIVAFIALFFFFKLSIASTEILIFYSDSVFADFDVGVMAIVLLVFLAAVATRTLRAMCRLNELVVPLIIAGIAVLIAIVMATGFDLANIFPALYKPDGFKKSLVSHAAWLGDFTPIILFMGRTKLKKHTATIAVGAGIIGSCVSVFLSIVMCAAFGNVPLLAGGSTNISNILQFSIGNVYGRIDLLSSILWSIAVFVEAALFFYSACRCVAFVIGKNYHFAIALSASVVLYVTLVFALIDPTVFAAVVSSVAVSAVCAGFTAGVPALALICAAIHKRKSDKPGACSEDTEEPESESQQKAGQS